MLIANPETAGSGNTFQAQGADGRNTGRVFTKNAYRFSYSKIDVALQRNRREEYMELASTAKGNGLGQANAPSLSVTEHGEFFSGSFGLLNGSSSYNATDAEANQEMAEILHRKRKTKRKREYEIIDRFSNSLYPKK